MLAVHRPAQSHFNQPPPESDPDVSDDDNHGEGPSSGILRGLGGTAGRPNTVASLLEESIKFVPERINRAEQAIPWIPVNRKQTNSTAGSTSAPTVNSPAPNSPNTPPPTASAPSPALTTAGFPTIPPAVAWPRQLPAGAGLHNLGNTCFLNSAVQCLLHTAPLVRYTLDHPHEPKSCAMMVKKGFCMQCAMGALVRQSFTGNSRGAYAPKAVVSHLKKIAKHMRLGRQEDSHEFLRFVVDALQESVLFGKGGSKLEQKIKETTFVHQIFGGRLRSRVLCTECNHPSDTFDSVLDLSLDIHRLDSLKDALQNFAKKDLLKGANKYKCDKCRKLVIAEKSFSIDKAPMVLTVHLKRFTPFGKKISDAIKYPEQLQLGPYMADRKSNPSYKLYGVINHLGGSVGSGHYTADVRAGNGQWYRADDTDVSKSNGAPLNAKSAYVLFYCREQGDALKDIIGGAAVASQTKQGKKRARDSMPGGGDVGSRIGGEASPHSAKKAHLIESKPRAEVNSPKPPAVLAAASAKASPSAPALASPASPPLVSPNPFVTKPVAQSPAAAVGPKSFYGGSPGQQQQAGKGKGGGAGAVQLPAMGKLSRRKDKMMRKNHGRPALIK